MANNYTENDLLLLIYNELPLKDALELEKAIHADEKLYKAYHSLLQLTGRLDRLFDQPSPTSVEIILEHSAHPVM